jgi:transposase
MRVRVEIQKRVVMAILCGGMTVDEAAAKVGVPPSMIRKWKERHSKTVLLSMAIH